MYKRLVLAAAFAGLTLQGCVTFEDGLAAIGGEGGTIERFNEMPLYRQAAKGVAPGQPAPLRHSVFAYDDADIMLFLDGDRLLVGSVDVGAYLGVPDHKELILYDTRSGNEIWRVERPSLVGTQGSYSIVDTDPLIVASGRDGRTAHVLAIDPASGATRWSFAVDQTLDSLLLPRRMIFAHESGDRLIVEARSLESGAVLWTTPLPRATDSAAQAGGVSLFLDRNSVMVVSDRLTRLSASDGAIFWQHKDVSNADGAWHVLSTTAGVVLWRADGLRMLDRAGGTAAWSVPFHGGDSIKLVARADNRIVAVVQSQNAFDAIASFSQKDGKRRWSAGATGIVVSNLLTDANTVTFTVDDALVALRANDGKQVRRVRFPRPVISATPTRTTNYMQPDLIARRFGNILVARDHFGILAIGDRSGKIAWSHAQPRPGRNFNPYTAASRYQLLRTSLLQHNVNPEDTQASTGGASYSYSVLASQQSLQAANSHWESIIEDTSRPLWERNVATHMTVANNQFAAAQSIASAGFALISALEETLKRTAIKGLIDRMQLQISEGVDMHLSGVGARYYVRPYFHPISPAKGVLVVDLRSGRKTEFLTSINLTPQATIGVDLPTYAISADGLLSLVDVSLHDATWEEQVKWKMRLPRASLLTYDLRSLIR